MGAFPRPRGSGGVLGFFEHNPPFLFVEQSFHSLPASFSSGVKGHARHREKFSLGNETILTRGRDTQDSQVPQLLPKLLPTERGEHSE